MYDSNICILNKNVVSTFQESTIICIWNFKQAKILNKVLDLSIHLFFQKWMNSDIPESSSLFWRGIRKQTKFKFSSQQKG